MFDLPVLFKKTGRWQIPDLPGIARVTGVELTFNCTKSSVRLIRWNDPAITVSGEMSVTSNGDRHTRIAEIAVPASYFASAKESQAFRLNVGWMDHDRPENTKPSTLWWRPGWGFDADYEGSATFTVQD